MSKRMARGQIRTKKAAKESGYRPQAYWLDRYRVPRIDAKPLTVKGEEFFCERDCEEATTLGSLRKEGLRPKEGAASVGGRNSRYGGGPVALYRTSDAEPIPKRNEKPPERIPLLKAIWAVSRSAKRYRDAAQSCYVAHAHEFASTNKGKKEDLYDLKDRGIAYAHSNGTLEFVGMHAGFAVYRGEGFCFHSRCIPRDVPDVESRSEAEEEFFVESRPRRSSEPRLKDAVATLQAVEEVEGYDILKRPTRENPKRTLPRHEQHDDDDVGEDSEDLWSD